MAIEEPKKPFTRLDPDSYGRSLAQKLSGRRLVDPLRNLLTRFGLRHYECRVVRIRWSGGERGNGEPYKDIDLLIEPTPKMMGHGLGRLNESVEGIGVQQIGRITLGRISTAYQDYHLRGLLEYEQEHPIDCEAFWEITYFGYGDAQHSRFHLAAVPARKTLGWEVSLERTVGQDRTPYSHDLPLSHPTEDPL